MIRIKEPVTKAVTKRPRVTKCTTFAEMRELTKHLGGDRPKTGRPRVHSTAAAKQKAYRERRKLV